MQPCINVAEPHDNINLIWHEIQWYMQGYLPDHIPVNIVKYLYPLSLVHQMPPYYQP